jgi:hypothetical protein
MYVCTYVRTYVYICMYVCVCMYLYVRMYINAYLRDIYFQLEKLELLEFRSASLMDITVSIYLIYI